jgi:hypothetical protein
MRRGEIRWYAFAPPDKQRPVLVLTRDEVIDRLNPPGRRKRRDASAAGFARRLLPPGKAHGRPGTSEARPVPG